ncbi:hypothetical protein HGRIS_006056 [Hohenbuehelia grisea]|uniref:SGF29 C-terminal domain-containing protein n=1 Tax=Hohenbuehelia grisea TaxID=104357 RepID=A0ABR3JZK1_9AGAR
MDRRRAASNRPASSEEIECWSHASASLAALATVYSNPSTVDTIERVNRLISTWPTDDLPAEGIDSVKTSYRKLSSGLHEIADTAHKEAKAIDAAVEHLDILIALRQAPEIAPAVIEKRHKRPRGSSPAGPVGLLAAAPGVNGRGVSITLPARGSVGPNVPLPFSRDPKARREALSSQLPLQEGRKVAFHPSGGKSAGGAAADADENTWILAVVTKCINADKNRYEVQDAEPQEDGQPGLCYNTTLRAIIPLPDPNAAPGSSSHLTAYQEFPAKSTVMALYPDTSCFYRAEVIATPKEMQPSGRMAPSNKYMPTYKLKFEDDDNQEHSVAAQWVVEWPGPT